MQVVEEPIEPCVPAAGEPSGFTRERAIGVAFGLLELPKMVRHGAEITSCDRSSQRNVRSEFESVLE